MRRVSFIVIVTCLFVLEIRDAIVAADERQAQAGSQRAGRLPSIAERTEGLQKLDGFFPLYWDEATGALLPRDSAAEQEVLYVTGVGAGMGSNDIGIDRASLAGTRIVSFERVGHEDADGAAQLRLPRAQSAIADERQCRRRGVRQVGHLGLHGDRRDERPRARRSRRLPDARHLRTWSAGFGRPRIASIARAAPSICRTRRRSRRTPRSK